MNSEDLARMDLADLEIEYRQVVMQRDDLLRELNTVREGGSLIYEISKDQSKTIKWALEQLKTAKEERDALRAENERLSKLAKQEHDAWQTAFNDAVRLEKSKDDWSQQALKYHTEMLAAKEEVANLKERLSDCYKIKTENKRLREALEEFMDSNNWQFHKDNMGNSGFIWAGEQEIPYYTAKQALDG